MSAQSEYSLRWIMQSSSCLTYNLISETKETIIYISKIIFLFLHWIVLKVSFLLAIKCVSVLFEVQKMYIGIKNSDIIKMDLFMSIKN